MNPLPESSPDSGGSNGAQRDSFLQRKFEQIVGQNPNLTLDQAFQLEYCRMYIKTIKLDQKVEMLRREVQELRETLERTPSRVRRQPTQHSHNQTSNSQIRKRVRRTANEIARHYICKVENCQKSYGSEGSLNQHMKLKHRQLLDSSS